MRQRYEKQTDLLHFECRQKPNDVISWLEYLLPVGLPYDSFRSKPLAKVGIRMQPSTSKYMDKLLQDIFNESSNEIPVTVFVYMWVSPLYRKQQLGDYLLHLAQQQSLEKNVQYMLIVHDDQGSGKLLEYYKERGFVPIFDFIDKGMIKKLL
jgi:GNAT superfamily N-acetyltransferase